MKVASKILCSVWAITLAVMLNLALSVGASGISIPPTVYCEQMPVSLAYDGASSPTCDYNSAYTYADEKENRSEKIGGVCAHFTEFLATKRVVANGACFVAGTLVSTENGKRPIEEIEQGDKVWSFNHESKEWELRAVVEPLIHNYDGNIYSIEVAGERIEATHNHPFWVLEGENLSNRSKADDVPLDEHKSLNGGRWVAAEELEVGDLLKLKNGSSARIENISSRSASTLVYNITVEELHNYAVGFGEILVHNKANVRILQTGGNTLNKGTAKELNKVFGTNLNRREMGKVLEELKDFNGVPGNHHGKIDALGNYLDDAGNVIDNLQNYLP